MTTLTQELKTYQTELPNLLARAEGKYVLIKGNKVESTFDSYGDALQEGYRVFKLEPFLVKQILRIEPIANFTRRYFAPCPA